MLIIGSQAMIFHKLTDRKARDTDVITTYSELQSLIRAIKEEKGIVISRPLSENKWHIRDKSGWNWEIEIAWKGSSGDVLLQLEGVIEGQESMASKEALLALKMSHRYLRNSPHFLKTMRDIQSMRTQGVVMTAELENLWLPQREAETYVYNHPKLNVDKQTFFDDSVGYVYDHDDLHRILAIEESPAYTKYMVDGEQVLTSREKFFTVSENIRLLGGLEEALVLCAERSLIPYNWQPNPAEMFKFALQKICTSITSGFFRQFCWEHYDDIVEMYEKLYGNSSNPSWVCKLKKEIDSGNVKCF